jgi:hypothetical protein
MFEKVKVHKICTEVISCTQKYSKAIIIIIIIIIIIVIKSLFVYVLV